MIPVNAPQIGQQDIDYVLECLRSGWISSSGTFLDNFEHRWATYCGRRFGIAVSSGTAALQIAVGCLGLQSGDEVIIPTSTIISCALAVIANGGVPVLVDSDPRTWCMDVQQIEDLITPRTRAIMPVHIFGHPVDMDPVVDLANRYGLAIIEDAAQAHGSEYMSGRHGTRSMWRRCGSFGNMSTFSFYANKLITTGEGGMLVTDDWHVAEKARELRNLCFQSKRRFYHEEFGWNFRLTNMQAALGLGQLERIGELLARKRWIGQTYTRQLSGIRGLQLPQEESWAHTTYWMYGMVLSEERGMNANQFAHKLKERGVETRPFFLGMHEQPALHKRGLFQNSHYPVAERIALQGLYLPSGLALTEAQLDQTCRAVREVLND